MKKKFTLFAILISLTVFSQAPNWAWAKSAGGVDYDYGQSTATDASGNVFITGYFHGSSIAFGATVLTNTNSGSADVFLVKYDTNGNVLWANSASGSADDFGKSISTDVNGNVFITGYFQSDSISFGTSVLTNTNSGTADIFIVKYDANGNVIWANSASGTSNDYGQGTSADVNGNVFITGYFLSDSISFGTIVLTNANSDTADIFIVKYDANGNVLWAKCEGDSSYDYAESIVTDVNGNVFITGSFMDSAITFGTTTLLNYSNGTEIFLVKYDSNGNVLWAKSAAGGAGDFGESISTDSSGNVYVAGRFYSPIITFGTITLSNAGSSGFDIFITKYDSNGNVLWAKSAGGPNDDMGYAVSTDANGNAYVTGYFASYTITFGTNTLTNIYSGLWNIFIANYDANGNVIWAKNAGGSDNDFANGISTDANGNVYVTGSFGSPTITFGTSTCTNASNPSVIYDIFLAKLDSTVINSISVANTNEFKSFQISPNPSSGKFTIQSSQTTSSAELFVTNILGEIIYINSTDNRQLTTEIDLSEQPNGIYFVNVKTEKESFTQKIVIQK